MINYLIKSGICLTLLLLFYHLVLEQEKMHKFNRFYLLGSVLFSFLAPLFIIYTKVAPLQIIETAQIITQEPIAFETATAIETPVNYFNYIIYFSIFISIILLIRFIKNVIAIYQKTRKNTTTKHQKATLVLVDDEISPHTFWNYIFINKTAYNSQKIEEELFTHELTHASQKHTFDVLLIEVLKIVFWFNPIFYFLKKTIQLNHEFLADTKVVTNHKNISEYQYLLLQKTAWNNDYYLASNLNYLLTKKRLLMMTKQSSPTQILSKKLAVLPVMLGFLFLFAERVEAQETITEEITKEVPLKNEYKIEEITIKETPKIKYINAPIKRKSSKQSIASESTLEDIRQKLNNVDPLKLSLTNKDSIIFKKNWFITIDNQKYHYTFNKNERIARYYKNGKLVNLDIIKEYNKKHKKFEGLKSSGKHYVFKYENKKQEIDREFSDLGGMYFRMSRAEKNKVPYPKNPIKPYVRLRKGDKIWYKKLNELTAEDKLLLPPPPPIPNASKEEILKAKKAYDNWKKTTGNDLPLPPKHKSIKIIKKGEKSNIPPPPSPVVKKGEISNIPPPPPSKKKTKNNWEVSEESYIVADINTETGDVYKRKDTKIKPTSNDSSEFIKLDENIKKNYFIEDKKTSKKEFFTHLKNNKDYHFGSAYTNKEKSIINMHISKSPDKIKKLMLDKN